MKETQFIEDRLLRDKNVEKVEILEKVKEVLLIPETEFMTVNQLAEYYSTRFNDPEKKDIIITADTIRKLYSLHTDEFESDGVCIKSYKDFLIGNKFTLESFKGKVILTHTSGLKLEVPNRGIRIFPRRAILRVGMLLRDSLVAKEIRNQLLNIEEKASDELKVKDINEEQTLMLNIGMAYASGNVDAIMKATTEYNAFQNRHIKILENDNRALAKGILEWEDRKKLNAGMRRLAGLAGKDFAVMWNELYKNLLYKYGISLKQRGDKPYINHIAENEWNSVLKVFAAMCEAYGQSPTEIFQTTPMDNLVLHN